jgi:hypothetical protein
MKHTRLICALAILFMACTAQRYHAPAYRTPASDFESLNAKMSEEALNYEMEYDADDSASSPQYDAGTGSAMPPQVETMMVYSGYLRLRVTRLLDAVDGITRIVNERDGYIESLSGNVAIVRIPATDFDAVMEAFAQVGTQLERTVQAADVSAEYFDLSARLHVYEAAKNRLLHLLETTKDIKERLYILQELKRISSQIETLQARLTTLKNLVDYYTITLELEPIVSPQISEAPPSPFAWIRHLKAHQTTLDEGGKSVSMTLPTQFVRFAKSKHFRAQTADTTMLRAGRTANDPQGTPSWWLCALHRDLSERGETLEAEGTAGVLHWHMYRNDAPQPRHWLVALYTQGRHLWVVEVFYPTTEAYEAHHESVLRALQTFQVTP